MMMDESGGGGGGSLLPETYVAYGVTDARPDFSQSRIHRTIMGGRLTRPEELEMRSGELVELEAAGVPIDPVHDESISFGHATRGQADPRTGRFWVEFKLHDTPTGRNKRDLIKAGELHDISLTTEESDSPRRVVLKRIALCSKGARKGTRICMKSPGGVYSTIQQAAAEGGQTIRQYIDPSVSRLDCVCGCGLSSTTTVMATENPVTVPVTEESKYEKKTLPPPPPPPVERKTKPAEDVEMKDVDGEKKKEKEEEEEEEEDGHMDKEDLDDVIQWANAAREIRRCNLSTVEKNALEAIVKDGPNAKVPTTIDVHGMLKCSNLHAKTKKLIRARMPTKVTATNELPPPPPPSQPPLAPPPLDQVMKDVPDHQRIKADTVLKQLRDNALAAQSDPSTYNKQAETANLDVLIEKLRIAQIERLPGSDLELTPANLRELLYADAEGFESAMLKMIGDAQQKMKAAAAADETNSTPRHTTTAASATVPQGSKERFNIVMAALYGKHNGKRSKRPVHMFSSSDDEEEEEKTKTKVVTASYSEADRAAAESFPEQQIRNFLNQTRRIEAASSANEQRYLDSMPERQRSAYLRQQATDHATRAHYARQLVAGYAQLSKSNAMMQQADAPVRYVHANGDFVFEATPRLAVEGARGPEEMRQPNAVIPMMEFAQHVAEGHSALHRGHSLSEYAAPSRGVQNDGGMSFMHQEQALFAR
jgi:NACalpha-BTF3-like transcription factor